LIPRVRPGGLVLVDNTIWYGQVINTAVNDPDTVAIRKVNDELAADSRLDSVIVPIGDGLTVCRKR
jgi:predicted O-methyltransferase YrrM